MNHVPSKGDGVIRLKSLLVLCFICCGCASSLSHAGGQRAPATIDITVSLTDGSRIVGTPTFTTVPLRTSFAESEIDLALIDTIEFDHERKVARLRFRNGDQLQGDVGLHKIRLSTLFGDVAVAAENIVSISVRSSSGALDKALVVHYSFDEEKDGIVKPHAGEDFPATLRGASWTPDGRINVAVRIHGTGDCVIIPYNKSLDFGTGDFTYCLWFRVDALGRSQQLYWHSYNPEAKIEPDGRLLAYFAYRFCGTFSSTSSATAGKWHFVAVTRENGTGCMYLDGRKENSVDAARCNSSSPDPVLLGSDTGGGEPFRGLIDELAIWGRALSESEIRALYERGRP